METKKASDLILVKKTEKKQRRELLSYKTEYKKKFDMCSQLISEKSFLLDIVDTLQKANKELRDTVETNLECVLKNSRNHSTDDVSDIFRIIVSELKLSKMIMDEEEFYKNIMTD